MNNKVIIYLDNLYPKSQINTTNLRQRFMSQLNDEFIGTKQEAQLYYSKLYPACVLMFRNKKKQKTR